jgi:hypothetical protein
MRDHRRMRAAALLLVAVASLSGCATVAEGATPATGTADSPPSGIGLPATADVSAPASPSSTSSSTPPPSAPPTAAPSASPSLTSSATAATAATASPRESPSPTQTAPAPDPAPVGSFVLGDSIGLSVAPLLSRYGFPVTGRVGQSAHAAFLQQYLGRPEAQAAPGWVIVLGTNNRGDQADIARLSEWIDVIADLRTRGAKQQVYWVTPHRPEAYAGGMSRWSLGDFNAELERLAGERRWLHVIDFDAEAAAHPEWFAQDAGRLHPNSDGQAALAALIAGADAAPAARSAPITTLEWPTPTPSPSPTASPDEGELFDNSVE